MLNNINSFNQAKMIGAQDPEFQRRYNFFLDMIQRQLKFLSAEIGITGE